MATKIQPIGEKELESSIPDEAIEESEKQRRHRSATNPPPGPQPGRRSDPFSEERVDKHQPPVDSSEETLGG